MDAKMDANISVMLDEAYASTLEEVRTAITSKEDAERELRLLSELHKQRMAEREAERECYIRLEELEMKKQDAEKADTGANRQLLVNAAAIVVPVLASSYWMAKGLKFEETGCFSSRALTWVAGHLRLFRK